MTNGEYFVLTHPNVKVEENGTCVWIYNLDSTICNHHTMSMEWWNEEMVDIRPKGKWIPKGRWHIDPQCIEYTCSICGRKIMREESLNVIERYPFCHCGADMRGELPDLYMDECDKYIEWG